MIDTNEVKKFISEYLGIGKAGEGDLKLLALWHMRADADTSPVDYWPVEPTSDVTELAAKIASSVNRDAKAFGGRQQYILGAYFGEARLEPGNYGARLPIVVKSKPAFNDQFEESPLAMSSEEANPRGFSAQAFRWAEGLSRIALPAIESALERQAEELQRTRNHVHELEAEIKEWHKREQELLDKQHERNLELRKTVFWERQKEQVAKQVMGLLSFLAASYLGPKAQAGGGVSDPLIKQFIDSIEPEQLPKVMGSFSQQQQMILMQIFDRHLTAQESEQKEEQERQADMERRLAAVKEPAGGLPPPPPVNPMQDFDGSLG